MAARSQAAAVEQFLTPLQQSISCVTKAVVVQGYSGLEQAHAMRFAERYIPLQGQHSLELSLLHQYALVADHAAPHSWTLHSTSYWYQVRQANGPEAIAFHWHPRVGRGQIPFPHLHVGGSTAPINVGGGKHVPTGRVSIEAVIRFLVKELHVRPLRADWEAILTVNEAEFDAKRTW